MSNELGIWGGSGKPWWEKVPAEVPCGRCDRDLAGPGAAAVVDPVHGYIVACPTCLAEIAKERARIDRVRTRAASLV